MDEVSDVFGFFGVGEVVGEVPVGFAEKLDYFAAEAAEKFGGEGAAGAVASVDYYFKGAFEFNFGEEFVYVVVVDVAGFEFAGV